MSTEQEEVAVEKKQVTTMTKSFLSGGFGGIAAVLVGHPFDLIKVRLQTAPKGTYTGILDVTRKAIATDGLRGLYRGMGPPLVGVTPVFALSFWAYDLGKKIVYSLTPNREAQALNLSEIMFAGGFSAGPTTLLMAPLERVKVLLQVNPNFKGPLDVIRQIYKEGGIASIYRGAGATLLRDIPGSAAYFGAYELTKRALTPAGATPDQLNVGAVLFAGGMAGVAMWTIAIPPDVIKSRLQSAPKGTYKGTFDVLVKLLKTDGAGALFKGLGPALLRAFPANAACFIGVEASLNVMNMLW